MSGWVEEFLKEKFLEEGEIVETEETEETEEKERWILDDGTGYYYDTVSHLWYDHNHEMYFDQNGQYYHWSESKQDLIPYAKERSTQKQSKEIDAWKVAWKEYDPTILVQAEIWRRPEPLNDVGKEEREIEINSLGASLGRSRANTVSLAGFDVSKEHAFIEFGVRVMSNRDASESNPWVEICGFWLRDLASRNGTYINDVRLENESSICGAEDTVVEGNPNSKQYTDCLLEQGDVINLGSSVRLVVISLGWKSRTDETYYSCTELAELKYQFTEQLQSASTGCATISAPFRPKSRQMIDEAPFETKRQKVKKEMRNLKAQLLGEDHSGNIGVSDEYKDRAAERRNYWYSKNPKGTFYHAACLQSEMAYTYLEQANVHEPISSNNKGRTLLMKMGWKEGQTLGKPKNQGSPSKALIEPLNPAVRTTRTGLGSTEGLKSIQSFGLLETKSQTTNIQYMQQRFHRDEI